MLSRIYLIRHGKTDGNRNHWYYGAADLPLNDEGLAEIKAYAAEGIYPEIPADADIYTTGLIRTEQTLEAIYGKTEHSVLPKLQEINFGKAECMTYDELKVFDNFEKWAWDTTGDERIADAETSNEFHKRIHEGLKELIGKHRLKEWSHRHGGQDAVSVVVCHGGVIACIMEKLFPAVCGSMWDWLPEPGFGYAVDFQDGDPYMYSKINDIGRLGLGLNRLPVHATGPSRDQNLQCSSAPEGSTAPAGRSKARIDHKAVRALIDTQMSKGHGYFELEFLAWPEEEKNISPDRRLKAVREALVKRYDRSRYRLTALVDASMLREARAFIRKSGAGYLDRLAVCGIERYYEDLRSGEDQDPETLAVQRIGGPEDGAAPGEPEGLASTWEKLAGLKAEGLIKKAGLAFSGSASLLDEVLKEHQELDYVELPVNYRMGASSGDLAQKYYTISRRRYKEILVRSPFDGGKLLDLSEEEMTRLGIRPDGYEAPENELSLRQSMAGYALMKHDTAPHSAADWALRYVLSFPFVVTCVATTGDPVHAAEDMDAADRFRPLTEDERERLL